MAEAITERLTKYEYSVDYPPREVGKDKALARKWYEEVFYAVGQKAADTSMTEREKHLYTLSAAEYISERRAGSVTCEEYATALVKRARYYRYMNQWTYRSYDLFDQAVATARELDALVARDGVESIAPLYGLMIPMKGTGAVVQYPSGSGVGILSGYTPVRDAAMTALIKERSGIIFGTSNVPEFALLHRTANPASGQTRNPYNHRLTVGGSSGGAASAVSSYHCPVAVTEDTGGSTRVPAFCNQNFGFDPPRSHYPNAGNPGLSYLLDQIGFNARSIEDIIAVDRALGEASYGQLHDAAAKEFKARPLASIKVGVPLQPLAVQERIEVNADIRRKLEATKVALMAAGLHVLDAEWPSKYFPYLGHDENVLVEVTSGKRLVNGKPLGDIQRRMFASCVGQMSQFIFEYLRAPVSVKEVLEDCGRAGGSLNPGVEMEHCSCDVDETMFRYIMGPLVKETVDVYNSYFDLTGADLIMLPCANAATPDLHLLAGSDVPLTPRGGSLGETTGDDYAIFGPLTNKLKYIHAPKMVVPTGLTSDGRPTGVQLWGRALPYDSMFDDSASAAVVPSFLHLVQRVAACIQDEPTLRRVDAPLVADLLP